VRVEVVFERNTSCKSYFQRVERRIFRHIAPFTSVVETQVSLQGKTSMLEAGELVLGFPVRTELVFERNTLCKSKVSK
jgi:hypothetical protein